MKIKNIEPKNYKMFIEAHEEYYKLAKKYPKVSVVLNCKIDMSVLEGKKLVNIKNYNILGNDFNCLIKGKGNQFLVFDNNEIFNFVNFIKKL